MKDVALIFPGQGAQKLGMGKDLYESCSDAKAVFEKANEVFGVDLGQIIFEGPEEKLLSTSFCQPAIFTVSMAALAALYASGKLENVQIKFTAGLSLGEYGAMCAAGVLSFEDCLKLIQKRAMFMEEATKLAKGKMAAIIGFEKDKLVEITRTVGCEVANFNAPDQIVITGLADTVDKACQMIMEAGAKRVMPLEVAGAFHSTLMQPAADKFKAVLEGVAFKMTDIQVVTNVTGRPQTSSEDFINNLPKQISSSVQWVDSVTFMASQGVSDLVEIGPGRVLKGLIRKIDPSLNVQNVQMAEDINALAI